MQPPTDLKIYHITHVANLNAIIDEGALMCDAVMAARGGPAVAIGLPNMKASRLRVPVSCHRGDKVGDFVPFYFCPRSIMLYVISRRNHEALVYRGGQDPIVHLQADLRAVVDWADAAGVRWAFSTANARAAYTPFFAEVAQLDQINWAAVAASNWRDAAIQEAKQAEFLVHGHFPWALVSTIGARTAQTKVLAEAAIATAADRPPVIIKPDWYY
jgi:hypothetical protein